ncbi:DUF5375 family protein [Salmonella enterica]
MADLMDAGPTKAASSLPVPGLAGMDELCDRQITAPVLH